jgi:hypothetical protein
MLSGFFALFIAQYIYNESSKVETKDSIFPSSFYIQEHNLFSKHTKILADMEDIVAVTENNLIAVGSGGLIVS